MPKLLVVDVPTLLIWKRFFLHCIDHTPERKGTVFTPAITVVVDAGNEIRIVRHLQQIGFIQGHSQTSL